jgi:hypothetical protein
VLGCIGYRKEKRPDESVRADAPMQPFFGMPETFVDDRGPLEPSVSRLPAPVFRCADDVFPSMGGGLLARLIFDHDRYLLYSLGDDEGPYAYQHVLIHFLDTAGQYAVRWYVSVLVPELIETVEGRFLPQKQLHYLYGRRCRRFAMEEMLKAELARLQRASPAGDFLRFCQQRRKDTGRWWTTLADEHADLTRLLWVDAMRVETERLLRMSSTGFPRSFTWQRMAKHLLATYPIPVAGCSVAWSRARRWRWRRRLVARVRRHYPLFTRQRARLLAANVAYSAV